MVLHVVRLIDWKQSVIGSCTAAATSHILSCSLCAWSAADSSIPAASAAAAAERRDTGMRVAPKRKPGLRRRHWSCGGLAQLLFEKAQV